MSTYYNPVSEVEKNGVMISRVNGYPVGRFKHRLVAVSDNGLWKRAVDVTSETEYDYFYEQYKQGMFLSFDLYDYKPE